MRNKAALVAAADLCVAHPAAVPSVCTMLERFSVVVVVVAERGEREGVADGVDETAQFGCSQHTHKSFKQLCDLNECTKMNKAARHRIAQSRDCCF